MTSCSYDPNTCVLAWPVGRCGNGRLDGPWGKPVGRTLGSSPYWGHPIELDVVGRWDGPWGAARGAKIVGDCGFEMALGAERLRPAFMVRRRGALEMPEGAPVALYRGSVGPVWTTQGLRGP